MKPLPLLKQLSGLILVFMLAACQVAGPTLGASPSPSLAPTRTRNPTATPTQTVTPPPPTPTATLAPTPTETLPPLPPLIHGLVRTGEIGQGQLLDAAWSPDGRYLVIARSGGVEVYDSRSFDLLHSLDTGPTYLSLKFSPSGRYLAVTIGWDEVHVWDLEQGEMKYRAGIYSRADAYIFTSDDVIAMSESPCLGAYGMFECVSRITIYNLSDYRSEWTLTPSSQGLENVPSDETYYESQTLYSLASSRDGKQLAAGGYDQQIHLWDLVTGEERLTLAGHTAAILSLAFSPDGRTLVSGGADGTLRWWSTQNGRLLRTLRDFPASITEISFSANGSELFTRITGSPDIQARSAATGALRGTLSSQNMQVLAARPDGSQFLSTNWTDLAVLNRRTGQEEQRFSGYWIGLDGLALSQDGQYLGLANMRSTNYSYAVTGFQIWDLSANQPVTTTWIASNAPSINSLGIAVHPRSPLAALATNQGVFLWEWTANAPRLILPADPDQDIYYRADQVVFSPAGDLLAIYSSHRLYLWDVQAGRLLFSREIASDWLREVVFSPAGSELALRMDGGLQIQAARGGEIFYQVEQPPDEDWKAISFAGPGQVLIATQIKVKDTTRVYIVRWDYARGQLHRVLCEIQDAPNSMLFSPDGTVLVAAGVKEVSFLAAASGQRMAGIPLEKNTERAHFTFAGDKHTLVMAEQSNRFFSQPVKLEAWDVGEIIAAAGEVLPADGEAQAYTQEFDPIPALSAQPVPPAKAGAITTTNLDHLSETLSIGKGAVRQAAWSPDSKTLGVASPVGVFLYDADTLAEKAAFTTAAPALSLAFSANGRWLAAGLANGRVEVWTISSGELAHTFQSQSSPLYLAFSPDSRRLAFPDEPAAIAIYDLERETRVQTLADHLVGKPLQFSPDGKTIFAPGRYDSLRGWNIDTGLITHSFSLNFNEGREVWAFALDPAGRLLFDGRQDGRFHVWDLRSGERVLSQKLAGEEDTLYYERGVSALAYDARHNLVAAAGYDRQVGLYNAQTGELQRKLAGHYQRLVQLAFRPDGGRLLSLDKHSNLKIWNPATGELLSTLSAHLGRLHSLNFAVDGSLQAASGDTGRVFTSAGALRLETGGLGGELLALSPDSRLAAVFHSRGIWDEHIQVWELRTRQMVYEFVESPTGGPGIARGYFDQATFSRDGDRLLGTGYTAGWPWDLETGETLAYPEIHNATHACTPRLSLCAFQEYGGNVSVWDFHTVFDLLGSFEWGFYPQPMAFHPDGVQLAASYLNRIRVLNLANGQMRQSDPAAGLEEAVLAFSPDGSLLAAGSRSGEIYFFDAKTLELLAFKPGSIGAVSHLSFSTDGRRLLFAGEDAVIHVWEIKP